MGVLWLDGDGEPLPKLPGWKWPRRKRETPTVSAMQILPPSGAPVTLSITITVSGPGAVEASDALVVEEARRQLVAEIEESFERASGFVPVEGTSLGLVFEP